MISNEFKAFLELEEKHSEELIPTNPDYYQSYCAMIIKVLDKITLFSKSQLISLVRMETPRRKDSGIEDAVHKMLWWLEDYPFEY